MSALEKFIFSLSVIFPATVAIFRYKNADRSYRPFLFYVFYSLANELFVGLYLEDYKDLSIANWHIFMLAECVLLLIQFYYWGRFRNPRYSFYLLLALIVAGWTFENFVYADIFQDHYGFLVAYSFMLVLLSINSINILFAQHNQVLHKNGLFIICVAIIIFFIYQIFVFMFLMAMPKNREFLISIFNIHVYINVITNIIYAIGIYYIPVSGIHDDFFKRQQRKNILHDDNP